MCTGETANSNTAENLTRASANMTKRSDFDIQNSRKAADIVASACYVNICL
jgi:hypothetical protein